MSGYSGTLPPSLKDFRSYKILGKYTPLDINLINKWFREHKDAILMTDIINTPSSFIRQFTDKSRLMMELLSWDALLEAHREGIKAAVPTGYLFSNGALNSDSLKNLEEMGINTVSINQKLNNTIVKRLLHEGFKLCAFGFHLPQEEQKAICINQNIF